MKRRKPAPSIDKLMQEVGGAIDQAIEQGAREAALRHVRDGRIVPVWENGTVVMKPAAQALAESDALAAAEKKPKRKSRLSA